jgi:hypothetical protein
LVNWAASGTVPASLTAYTIRRRMKKTGYVKLFDGLNYAGAALTLLAALGVIAAATRLSADLPYLLPLVLIVYGSGQFLIVLANMGLANVRFTAKSVVALTVLHTLLSVWDLFAILIGLPFIAISMILGPFMIIVFALAAVALGMYAVEGVLGYDIRGYSSVLENPIQALVALVVLVISFLILRWHVGKDGSEDWLMEKAGDLSFHMRQRLQGKAEDITSEHARDG